MSDFLGIDTSNYTTSAAIYESPHNVLLQEKMLLPVKKVKRNTSERRSFPPYGAASRNNRQAF